MALTPISGEIQAQPLNDNFSFHNEQLVEIAYNVKSYGVTGIGDETSLMQTAINDIADRNGLIFIPRDMTVLVTALTITGKSNFGFKIEGVLKRPDNSVTTTAKVMLTLDSCTNVTMPIINFDGNAVNNGATELDVVTSAQEGSHCLHLQSCNGIKIGNIDFKNILGDGIYNRDTNNLTVFSINSVSDISVGRNVLSIISGRNIFVDTINSIKTGHYTMPGCFDIEPNSALEIVDNVHVNSIYTESAGTNPVSILATNASTVTNIHIIKAIVKKIKVNTVGSNCCVITGSNVTIDYLYGDGALLDNFLSIDNNGVDCKDVTIVNGHGVDVNNGIILGFSGHVENIDVKVKIENAKTQGLWIIDVKNLKADIDIDSVGTSSFMIVKTGAVNAENVYITGNISKRGTGTYAMRNAELPQYTINWTIENLDFTGWVVATRIMLSGFNGTVRKINCPNLNYSTVIPNNDYWKIGDIIYNTSPIADGYIGWVCTASGNPGTWKEFGLIRV